MSEPTAPGQDAIPEDAERVDIRVATGGRGVMTFAEVVGGELLPVALELLGPARRMAAELETDVTTIVIGRDPAAHAERLIHHGADRVVCVQDDRLEHFTTLPYARAIADWIENEHRPEILLLGATTTGRDLAPRVASRVRAGVTADCTKLSVGEYYHRKTNTVLFPVLEAWRPSYGETKLACIVANPMLPWCPQMATARPGTFQAPAADASRSGETIMFEPTWQDGDFAVKVVEVVRGGGDAVDLGSAKVIIAGGVPCGDDRFALVKQLADALEAQGVATEWAASRAAVDAGHAPHSRQVGQTGVTVRPAVYVAIAVSGAPQHWAGMKESGRIIAINTDAQCRMVQSADAAIIGDYRQVLPDLIAQVESGFTFGLAATLTA